MDLLFFPKNDIYSVKVSDDFYEYLAKIGLAKIVTYKNWKTLIEDESETIFATKLNRKNRKKIISLIEGEIINSISKQMPLKSITNIKDFRMSLSYIEDLIIILNHFKNTQNLFFSYLS